MMNIENLAQSIQKADRTDLIQLIDSGDDCLHFVTQTLKGYTENYGVTFCSLGTFQEIFNAVGKDMSYFKNFGLVKDSTGTVRVDRSRVPIIELQKMKDMHLEILENKNTIWYVFNILKAFNAKFEFNSNNYIPIENINFSYSTNSITVSGKLFDSFRTKVIWSRDIDYTPITFECSGKCAEILSGIENIKDDIIIAELGHDDIFYVSMNTALLDSECIDSDMLSAVFSIGSMLDNIWEYEVNRQKLKALSYIQSILMPRYPDEQTQSRRSSWDSNDLRVIVKNNFIVPKYTRLKKVIEGDIDNYIEGIKSREGEDRKEYIAKALLGVNRSSELASILTDTLDICLSKDGEFLQHEAELIRRTAMQRKFDAGMQWFKWKIQMMNPQLQSYLGKLYTYKDGTILLGLEGAYEL